MAEMRAARWRISSSAALIALTCMLASVFAASAERNLLLHDRRTAVRSKAEVDELQKLINFLKQPNLSSVYQHAWPVYDGSYVSEDLMIALGTLIGFFGAAFGSVGGVGGGGIFVPMLTLVIGFDAKSSTAISKCMIMGAAGTTVYYNLKLRHPTLPLPIIDYDLALLFQPMLMLGISIGVAFNVVFAEWMVTLLLIVIFMVTSTKAFLKGIETWKKETKMKMLARAAKEIESEKLESAGAGNGMKTEIKDSGDERVALLDNVYWKELLILTLVWIAFLCFQVSKNYTRTCSTLYWILNLLQVPVAVGVTLFQAVNLYKGGRTIASEDEEARNWNIHQLVLHCCFGTLAGIVGGLLGLGGGFILVPLFLELGIPPQVASATATFVMTFSSSMSVVEYYLLKRIPVPYALYFTAVAAVAAFVGQRVVRKLIIVLGRASIIIFILASTIFVSAISLGGVGMSNMIHKISKHEYMGFESLCLDSG